MLDLIGRDLRQASRGLLRRPSFAFAAVVTLALGIAATTAIFSVVYSVLIKPLPYPGSDELVRIRHDAAGLGIDDVGSSPTLYFTYRDRGEAFAEIGMWSDGGETLSFSDGTARIRSLRLTHGVLQALGVPPLRGRWFQEREHGPEAEGPDPVILSYGFWQSQFGGREATLGSDLVVNGSPARVVGVMPPDFTFLDLTPQPDVIVAVRLDPARESIGGFGFHALARLEPGTTLTDAAADLERMLPIWLDTWPINPRSGFTREAIENWRLTPVVQSLKGDLVGGVSNALWVLMGAIGAVLLVACANIANLMLVHADSRRQEFAVRAALGAVPARIARGLLVESLMIGAIGGALGLVLASAGLALLVAIGPSNLPRLDEISIHPPVLAFTVIVSLASTLVFGSFAALKHALRLDAIALSGSRGSSASRERNATRSTLVVVQIALALVLVVGAVLMLRTFQALRDVDPGFADPATVQTARTWIPSELFADARRYTQMQRQALDAVRALPGVTAAGFTSTLPMEGPPFLIDMPVVIEGRPQTADQTPPPRRIKRVSPGYLEAVGTRIIAGRDISWSDIEAGGHVALVSEAFARELAGEPGSALGARIRGPSDNDSWLEIIGVTQSVRDDALYTAAPSLVHAPVLMENAEGAPSGTPTVAFVVRSDRTGTASLTNEIRQAIWSVNRDVPIALERTMEALYSGSLARTSFTLVMLAIAGLMALALGIVGIYGVISYVAAQRTREIGIRMALGAERRHVRTIFLRQGLALSAVGLTIGLAAAIALTRLMSSLLFEIEPTDAVTYAASLGTILAAAAIASYLPARRASTIDPMETLKAE